MTFKPTIPKNLLLDGEHSIDTHFALVNYQVSSANHVLLFYLLFYRLSCISQVCLLNYYSLDETNKDCACCCFSVESYIGEILP